MRGRPVRNFGLVLSFLRSGVRTSETDKSSLEFESTLCYAGLVYKETRSNEVQCQLRDPQDKDKGVQALLGPVGANASLGKKQPAAGPLLFGIGDQTSRDRNRTVCYNFNSDIVTVYGYGMGATA